MTAASVPFIPPAPVPRTSPPSLLRSLAILYRNPLELWGVPAYTERWLTVSGIGGPLVIANDPGLVRHVLVDNQRNYRMARVRQRILRPILRDGLLTAEGETWKRTRRALAPAFTPRAIGAFAGPMLKRTEAFAERYDDGPVVVDVARDMTQLTYDILAETLFSGEIAAKPDEFQRAVDLLFETLGRVDPLDALGAPGWFPRLTRVRGRKALAYFRTLVTETMAVRRKRMRADPDRVPHDFLTMLLAAEGPNGLTTAEVEDNVITFIGAGHETTARALAWTIYLLSQAPEERARVEAEIDALMAAPPDPALWLDNMPATRAAFEEAMRLYPPAPSINREAIADDTYREIEIPAGAQVLVLPWILHRHRLYWDRPDAFMPSRFHPENRDAIDRYQYLPFGAGARICIGAAFAMQEAMIALAILLSRYRFEATPECRPWPVQKLTTQPAGGLPMSVARRA